MNMATTTKQERQEQEIALQQSERKQTIMETLEALGGSTLSDNPVDFGGERFNIPETHTLPTAIPFLEDIRDDQERESDFVHRYPYRPLDGAACAWRAMRRVFGAVSHKGAMGLFGRGAPTLIDVQINHDETEQVPWGSFTIGLLADVEFVFGKEDDGNGGLCFVVSAIGPKKWASHIQGVFKLIAEELETGSIYRGKAIDGSADPNFLDLSAVEPDKVVYSEQVVADLTAKVWSPLRNTEAERELNLPLKRAILLEGPYGTGKTLAAYLTAQEAVGNGWTFLMARPGRDDLQTVMQTARLYQPSVVFFEDIDNVSSPEDSEHDHITQLLDAFDGLSSKGTEIICILTTNHKERIHKGMIRPGRLDGIISIGALDRVGVEKLVRVTVRPDCLGEIDFDEVYKYMDGYMPAFVKEAADLGIRYALGRTGNIKELLVTTDDLVHASEGLRTQFKLMEGASDELPETHFGKVFKAEVQEATVTAVAAIVRPDLLIENGTGKVPAN